jgi:hypothetical protein
MSAAAEIKQDVEVIANTFNVFLGELEKVNFEVTRVPPAALQSLPAPEFQQSTTPLPGVHPHRLRRRGLVAREEVRSMGRAGAADLGERGPAPDEGRTPGLPAWRES